MQTSEKRQTKIAIIGSGFAGLGLGIRLKKAGVHDFLIFERASDVGGVWRDNSYPGCACDVESHLYSFSFAPNPNWSRQFSGQQEIWNYLKDCAKRHDLESHFRFNHELHEARWNEQQKSWSLQTSQGTYEAPVFISATGAFSEPLIPDLKGLSQFKGEVFHSAHWNHAIDLAERKVAVIGTGASAIQFIPEIQPLAEKLTVFQRTPPWILPRLDRALTPQEQNGFRENPLLQKFLRLRIYWIREFYGLTFRVPRFIGAAKGMALHHMKKAIKDPALREKVTPKYTIGCKRVLISNNYFPALAQKNVEVVTTDLREVTPQSLITADGVEHPADVIILGTGFRVTEFPIAKKIFGRDGISLSQKWAGSPTAYLGTAVAGLPNFFCLLGPNTGLGHTSVVLMIEAQIGVVIKALLWMRRKKLSFIEPLAEKEREFAKEIDRKSRKTVWLSGGCQSWYLDQKGRNSTLWPSSVSAFIWRLRNLRRRDYLTERSIK